MRKLEFGKKKQEKTCRGFKDLTTTILCVQLNCQYKRRAGDKDVLLCGETEARAAVPLAPLVSGQESLSLFPAVQSWQLNGISPPHYSGPVHTSAFPAIRSLYSRRGTA